MFKNLGTEIAAEADATRAEAARFGGHHESTTETSARLAFQIMVASLDAWPLEGNCPLGCEITADSVVELRGAAADIANTIKLRELTGW